MGCCQPTPANQTAGSFPRQDPDAFILPSLNKKAGARLEEIDIRTPENPVRPFGLLTQAVA